MWATVARPSRVRTPSGGESEYTLFPPHDIGGPDDARLRSIAFPKPPYDALKADPLPHNVLQEHIVTLQRPARISTRISPACPAGLPLFRES